MNKIYYLKNNKNNWFEEKKFEYNNIDELSGFEKGDYAIVIKWVKDRYITQLWFVDKEESKNDKNVIYFKNLYENLSKGQEGLKPEKDLIALKLFKLDITLLNYIIRPVKNRCFFLLELVEDKYLDIIKNERKMQEYINNTSNYRKIIIRDSLKDVNKSLTDVQLYWENAELNLYFDKTFMDDEIREKFSFSNYKNGKYAGHEKGKLYKEIEAGRKEFSKVDVSLNAFYDLFISKNKKEITDFEKWLKTQEGNYSNYPTGIRAIKKEYKVDIDGEYQKDKCNSLKSKIKNDPKVNESIRTQKRNLRNWGSYLNKYVEYLDWKNNFSNDAANNNEKINNDQGISEELEKYIGTNTIFYGVPGCGKSHKIDDELLKGVGGGCYKRILFHPEYSYSDFVGQIRPVTKGEKIDYDFVPGPFTEILCEALKNQNKENPDKDKQYFLVIEEINRGNAPAIFGDVFQLLDRNENGESEYEIDNADILKYLKQKGCCLTEDKIKIPSNLTIFATMNTSDQNVFVMDTAFKRRWHMERIKNEFTAENPMGKDDAKLTIKDGNGNDITIKWSQFMIAVNDEILEHCKDEILVEDKLLGTNFVNRKELYNVKVFADKVFEYLWNDVVKYNKEQLFDKKYKTLDEVINDFCSGINVFSQKCEKIAELYLGQENSEE